jgi:integrase
MSVRKKQIDGQERFHVRVTCHGQSASRLLSAGATRSDARRVEAALVEELRAVAGQGRLGIIGVPTIEQVLDGYIADLQQRGKPLGSIRRVQASKNHLGDFFGDRMLRPAVDLTPKALHDFQQFALDKGLHPATVNHIFSILRAAMHVACPSFEFPKGLFLREVHQLRVLNPDDFQAVIARLSPPYNVVAELSGVTVMRLSEILSLPRAQVDLSAGVIHLEGRVVVLGARAQQILEEQLRSHNSEWVFPAAHGDKPMSSVSVTRHWGQAARSAGRAHLPFHFLRLLAVELAANKGVPIHCLASFGGWKLAWRSLWAHVVPGWPALRKAADAIAEAMKWVFITKQKRRGGN